MSLFIAALGLMGIGFGRLGARNRKTTAGGGGTAGQLVWSFPLITKAS